MVLKESVLRDTAKSYAKNVVYICRKMKLQKVETVLVNQFLRCSTSIGANIHEGQYAHGPKDLISKFEIALKECYESEYWLEILYETSCLEQSDYEKLKSECISICRMLVSSVKTLKLKLEK